MIRFIQILGNTKRGTLATEYFEPHQQIGSRNLMSRLVLSFKRQDRYFLATLMDLKVEPSQLLTC